MKNFFTTRIAGIIALAAVIGFSMAACESDAIPDVKYIGEELEVKNQQVYTAGFNATYTGIAWAEYNKSADLDTDSLYGGTGKITNGKLGYSIGTPAADQLYTISDFFGDDDSSYTVTPSSESVNILGISGFRTTDDDPLYKANVSFQRSDTLIPPSTTISFVTEEIVYIYVDSDVTVTGKGGLYKGEESDDEDDFTYVWDVNNKDFNLSLKKGWNAVNYKSDGKSEYSATTTKITGTVSITLGEPSSTRWILGEIDYFGDDSRTLAPSADVVPFLRDLQNIKPNWKFSW